MRNKGFFCVILLTITVFVGSFRSAEEPAKVVAGIPVNYDESLVGSLHAS